MKKTTHNQNKHFGGGRARHNGPPIVINQDDLDPRPVTTGLHPMAYVIVGFILLVALMSLFASVIVGG